MRQQAKPFRVEIKKSRKSASEPQPLFGFLEEAVARVTDTPAARLFERPPAGHNGADGHANVHPDIDRVFGAAAAPPPVNRILPDLTAKPVGPEAEDEAPRERRPRIARTKSPRIPKPKPLPVTVREPVVQVEAAAPVPAIRVRRRPKDEAGLARSERWKRRLPRFAR